MAHFAKIEDNIVRQVIVLNNEVILDELGNESEAIGSAFCKELFGGEWIQTSYSASFRGKFAGIGDLYDYEKNEFTAPKVVDETLAE